MKPSKTAKLIEFGKDGKLVENIQAYANLNTNGNFTKAVNKLVDKALTEN